MPGFSNRTPPRSHTPHRVGALEPRVRHLRYAERSIAFLRIVVGLWFLKSMMTKLGLGLLLGFIPVPAASDRWVATMPRLLGRYMAENPVGPYRAFVEGTVLDHPVLFANLTALGETAVGIGLTLGLLTGPVSLLGMWLVANYGLSTFHMGPSQQGFHILLLACLGVFVATRAGRRWGADGWLHAHRARVWGKVPLT
jgi:thiosulfate dehydrogenase (quinone) large subunit